MQTKPAIGLALLGAFLLGATVVAYSAAQTSPEQSKAAAARVTTSFSDLQEEEIGEIVRAYLLENPEVIIESVNQYSARQRQAADQRIQDGAAQNLARLLNPDNGFIAGKNPAKATVAVIEMADYHCSVCKRAAGLMRQMTQDDEDVKVIFRELPIFRKESEYAAEMALAARDQGKFLDMHFAMMEAKGTLTKDRVHKIAKKLGLDVSKMEAARQGDAIPAAIKESYEIAEQMGVEGTPTFIIARVDGSYLKVIPGYAPDELKATIKEAKNAAK